MFRRATNQSRRQKNAAATLSESIMEGDRFAGGSARFTDGLMAERGKPLEQWQQDRIKRLSAYMPIKKVAKIVGVDRNTVRKYGRDRRA